MPLVKAVQVWYFIAMSTLRILRSRRRTLALEITSAGELLVRAPLWLPRQQIDAFVRSHQDWSNAQLEAQRRRRPFTHPDAGEDEIRLLTERTRARILPRVEFYAQKTGLVPTGVRITRARTRYGSCSAKNALCFSCFLADYPDQAVDLVVVHELVHIAVKNHGPAFYARLAEILPDWKARRELLRHPENAE